jgi:hypothetical protein
VRAGEKDLRRAGKLRVVRVRRLHTEGAGQRISAGAGISVERGD